MRLARAGKRHPDPEVASVADSWAQSLAERPPSRIVMICVYEIVAIICLYALTRWLFGFSFQDISPLMTAPFIILFLNLEVRAVRARS
jgi:hypothetical protein